MKTTWTSHHPHYENYLNISAATKMTNRQKHPWLPKITVSQLCFLSPAPRAWWAWRLVSLVGKFWRGSELLAASATDPQQQGPCQGLFFIGFWGIIKEEKEKKHSTDFSCMAWNSVAWILWLANWSSLGCLPCTIWGRKKRCKGKTGSRFYFLRLKRRKRSKACQMAASLYFVTSQPLLQCIARAMPTTWHWIPESKSFSPDHKPRVITPLQEVKISRQQRWAELYKILWSPCAAHLRIYGGREGAWVWASELPPVNRLCPAVCQAQGGRKHFYLQKDPDDGSSQTMHRYFRPPVRARYPERGVASYCYHTM